MTKMAMTALAVVLLAQAAPAMAQDRGVGRSDRSEVRSEPIDRSGFPGARQRDGGGQQGGVQREWRGGQQGGGQREWRGGREGGPRDWNERRGIEAPRAMPAPQAPRAAEPRSRGDDRRWDGRGEARRDWNRDDARDANRDRRDWDRRAADPRRDWNGRDRRDWDRRTDERRWDGRNWDGRRDWDRGERWSDRRYDNYRRWERGRYPSVYASAHRYRYAWRPPSGFYLRVWSYGEYFPRGWFGPDYWIVDPWQYDLPLPPPGYDWVRSGPDALLIDQYSGMIVQVVRDAFWW